MPLLVIKLKFSDMSKTRSNKHDDDEKKKKKIKTGTAKIFFKPEEYDYSSFNIYPQ